MYEMQFDFDGLIQLLAGHLYSEKKVFIRELVQNCHDAIQQRITVDSDFELENGRIDIYTDLSTTPAIIRFRDNGIGMSKKELQDYLSSVGAGAKRIEQNEKSNPNLIGQFGIGFLSGFLVAKKIEVRTRLWNSSPEDGWLWTNEGQKNYNLSSERVEKPGTEVKIFLASAEDNGLIQDETIRNVIRTYADMLKIPIYLNYSETPINQRIMPWERKDISDKEKDIDCRIYLEKNMPDSVLEVIPLDESGEVNVSGVLYITRTRVIGRDTPRVLRIFQKRMFLCENTPEILPKWATFINGVINTPDLSPNAARDNFRRDEKFEKLRDRLGEIIISHFEKLKKNNRERLSEILAYHDFGIKAACYYYNRFFEKFGHLLEWRVNSKSPAVQNKSRTGGGRRYNMLDDSGDYAWVTLPDIIASIPEPKEGGLKRLNCFTTHSSANQFFEMSNAAGTTVLDASSLYEDELIKIWAQNHPEIRIVYIDKEDDPNIFRDIDMDIDKKVSDLANQMSLFIKPGGSGRLRAEARRFEPKELPAVLKSSPEGDGARKAREILNDPNSSASLRAMAEEMLFLTHGADMRMNINASNPLIRQLAELSNFEDKEVQDIMVGIYNDAILYNQELMTPTNAKIFHEQFSRLLQRSVKYLQQREKLRLYEERQRELETPKQRLSYRVAFYMTPFDKEFSQIRDAIRIVVEDKLGCQLLTAADLKYDRLISGNVRKHIDIADFFIADVTGANPNVMQELGAVHYGKSASPTLLIAGLEDGETHPTLPADLQGHITCLYNKKDTKDKTINELFEQFMADHALKRMLDDPNREIFLSPATLQNYTRNLLQDIKIYEKLSQKFPTASAWKSAKVSEVAELLAEEADMASVLIKRVKKNI